MDGHSGEKVSATESNKNRVKVYTTGKLAFVHEMYLPIKHIADWKLIHQHNQEKTNYYNNRRNTSRVDYDYQVGGKVVIKINNLINKNS